MPFFFFLNFSWLWCLVLNKLKPTYCKRTQNCSQTFHCPQDWGTTFGIQRQFFWFVFRSPELFGVVGSSDKWCYHIYWAPLGQRLQRSRCSFYSCQIVHIFWKLGSAVYPIDLEHSDILIAFRMDSYFLCKLFFFTGRNVLPGCIYITLQVESPELLSCSQPLHRSVPKDWHMSYYMAL